MYIYTHYMYNNIYTCYIYYICIQIQHNTHTHTYIYPFFWIIFALEGIFIPYTNSLTLCYCKQIYSSSRQSVFRLSECLLMNNYILTYSDNHNLL